MYRERGQGLQGKLLDVMRVLICRSDLELGISLLVQ
jgi:hypothetical protein